MLKGKPAQRTKKRRGNRGEVAATGIVETGKEALMINNIGIQRGDSEEDDNGVANCMSTLRSQPPAAPANEELAGVPPVTSELGSAESPVLPYYFVGRGISLPFGQVLPQCSNCNSNALVAWNGRSNPTQNGVLCLDHGLVKGSDIRDLRLPWNIDYRYRFLSPEHEAALREFLA